MRLCVLEPLALEESASDVVEALDGGPFGKSLPIMPDGFVELPLRSVKPIGQLQLLVILIALQLGLFRDEANRRYLLLWVFQQMRKCKVAALWCSPQVQQSLYLLHEVMPVASSPQPHQSLPVHLVDELEVSTVGYLQAFIIIHNMSSNNNSLPSRFIALRYPKALSSCN